MGTTRNEIALRRARKAGHPSADGNDGQTTTPSPTTAPLPQQRTDSTPLPSEECARQRDLAARARDDATRLRDELAARAAEGDPAALDRLAAATDRAAAALDRYQAAVDRQRADDYLRRTARDGLTGALTRDVGMERLEREVERALREGVDLIVAFVDVDGLKHVNDTRGHLAGDSVLQSVGASLRGSLRGYDVCVRFGGDEFVCALSATSLDAGRSRFADVQRALSMLQPGCSISVGLAHLRDGETLREVMARADTALYAARRSRPSLTQLR